MTRVTLSSTKSEYVSMSEGLKDLKFSYTCLSFLQVKVKLSMTVIINNVGAIEMLSHHTISFRTKHVDTRFHWIWDNVPDKFVQVKYIKSEDNKLGICTITLTVPLFKKHAKKFVTDVRFCVWCDARRDS